MVISNFSDIKSAVYKINTANGSGTCFKIAPHNIFITNYHVIAGCKRISIEDHKKDRYVATVRYVNPETDIAILIGAEELKATIPFHNPHTIDAGEYVSVLGFPFGMPFTVTEGIVSNARQILDGKSFIQTDAAINPGNSGGPVINKDGNIVGITTSKFTQADNVGFAIPSHLLWEELHTYQGVKDVPFAIKCNSCKNAITERTEYCAHCGADVDIHLFDDYEVNPLAEFIEKSISALKTDPVLARAGKEYWEFYHGSSLIKIFVHNHKYLYATSPLNNLPSQNLERLYRYLLSNPVSPYQLGIDNHQIIISYRTHLSDILDNSNLDIQQLLTQMLTTADEMDDFFVRDFGCEKTSFAKY